MDVPGTGRFALHEASFVLGLVSALLVVVVAKVLWGGAKLMMKLAALATLIAGGGGLYYTWTGQAPPTGSAMERKSR